MWTNATFGRVHVASLALCAIMLPWSTAFLSMAQMLMVANWLAWCWRDRDLVHGARSLLVPGPAWAFLSILLLHVLGLAWTSAEGMAWGLDLVRILLPVLTFGVVLSATPRLGSRDLRAILLLGAWSVVASTLVSLYMAGQSTAYRDMSGFISHIRLALLLAFAVVVFLHHAPGAWWRWAVHVAAAAWALHYINRLGSLQSMALLLAIGVVLLWRWAGTWQRMPRLAMRSALLALALGLGIFMVHLVNERYRLPPAELAATTHYTAGGEAYAHVLDDPQTENGEHVWTWVALGELYRAWPHRSDRPLNGPDGRGHPLYGTLVRYMASLGMRKDSVGVMSLSDEDISKIEQGIPSALAGSRSQLHERFEEVLFELEQYRSHGRASGHSVTMRLEFMKVGWEVAREHWAMGVGTGDTQLAFNAAYERTGTQLERNWWLRAHNQYLTWWISFGVFGLAWILWAIWWPAWRSRAWRDPLFLAWAVLFLVGSFTDDTLETQAGATFFAFHYALFVFAAPRTSATS
jgi:hypothetical protein